MEENRCNYSSPGLISMDSAIHSWDSNTVDNVNDNMIGKCKNISPLSVGSSFFTSYVYTEKKCCTFCIILLLYCHISNHFNNTKRQFGNIF